MIYLIYFERIYENKTIRAEQPVEALDKTHAKKIFLPWGYRKYKAVKSINIIEIYEKTR
jgi:hypothetical protein